MLFSGIGVAQTMAGFELGAEGQRWVDSVFQTLTPERKVGQLFMIAEFSDPEKTTVEETMCLIRDYGLGGVCFFKGSPYRQALMCNTLQKLSKVPMLISMDAEWGLAMRLDSVVSYPKQMALGASNDSVAVYGFAADAAKQCRRLGVHISFSPVADVNNNRLNPVIGDRSFGEDKTKVARLAAAYTKGLQDYHIMACGKHFPGHGNTESDSHLDLPIIRQSAAEIDSVELYPYKTIFAMGLKSIMAGHLYIPSLDSTANTATSISNTVIKNKLRKELGFDGLVFTDALNMKGVSRFLLPHELNLKALKADNDILLYAEDIPQSVNYILESIKQGNYTQDELDRKVKRVLAAKYWCGLNQYQPIDTTRLYRELNLPEYISTRNKAADQSVILLRNDQNMVPFKIKSGQKTLVLAVGYPQPGLFEERAALYTGATVKCIDKNVSWVTFDSIYQWVDREDFDQLIVSLHATSRFITRKYGFTPAAVSFINKLPKKKTLFVYFGNVYATDSFPEFKNMVVAHEDWEYWQEAAARLIFNGSNRISASMPVTASAEYTLGSGIQGSIGLNNNLSFADPHTASVDSKILYKVDSICLEAIKAKATPGCQVLCARNGQVFYYKSFGTFSYEDTTPVNNLSWYDIASVTKILATNLAVMKLYAMHKIDLNAKASKYLKDLRKTNKKDITIRQLLTHTGGLIEWIPFYKNTVMTYGPDSFLYSKVPKNHFQDQVADSLYISEDYKKTLWDSVLTSPVKAPGNYAYSDLGFMILKRIIEKTSGHAFEDYLKDHLYKPLGLHHILFNPLKHGISQKHIVPTEFDILFRKQLLQGWVHDPTAAMTGGINGHAGLFANAFDVAQLMQFYLNGGSYNMISLFSKNVTDTFTAKQYRVRRGLGFDKPETEPGKPSPCCALASPATFGHQGFTGTCTWADPETGLVFVFLSNRVCPDSENKKLTQMNVRTAIQEVFYKSLIKP